MRAKSERGPNRGFKNVPIGPNLSDVAQTSQLIGNILHVYFSGVITRADLLDWAQELTRIEAVLPMTPHRLNDISGVIDLPFGYDDINAFRRLRQSARLRNPIRSALYAPNDLQFGLSRMFQMLHSQPEIEVGIFRDREKAVAWLEAATVAAPLVTNEQ